ncbi:carbon starvation protein A [Candidatus Velamenicoccus archaeovorus]|uniref:Carbon starvation protein A n=1 Tax=Velamenicoccus archaeovorus TaxID=1930593 RepID=A0A410P4G9_VELA1|nr:carbon starvation protein A [Candidatus Velamenicoccus archaeovorus]QAT17097.1 carbon starvation protein A [Candidatus Velamenicoccus archaeovorus]
MSSLVVLLGCLAVFALGYFVYGGRIAGLFPIDPRRETPAVKKFDGVDYVPAKNWLVLFGHHFSSIAGAGPIIGPVIGCIWWGWFPSVVWIVLGTVLVGGVHDFAALMISVREEGASVAEVSATVVSRKARLIFSVFVWLTLILVIAVFADLCAKTFIAEKKIVLSSLGLIPVAILTGYLMYVRKANLTFSTVLGLLFLAGLLFLGKYVPIDVGGQAYVVWLIVLLVYCFAASVTPVNILLQPRDYLCSFLLLFGAGMGLLGLVVSRPVITQPAFISWQTSQGALWPMMCVTIACGAISGFHAIIASGTTSKQLASERHGRKIGYGAMVAEGLVALIAVLAVVSGIPGKTQQDLCLLFKDQGPICLFGTGYTGLTRVFFGDYGLYIAVMILNAFILTTLDTATRVCRYITQELTGLSNRFVSTLIVVAVAGILAFSGAWSRIWPIFGASNQLVAALALFVASLWFLMKKKPTGYTLVPAIFMFLTTVAALGIQYLSYLRSGQYLLAGLSVVLLILALVMVGEVYRAFFRNKRGQKR